MLVAVLLHSLFLHPEKCRVSGVEALEGTRVEGRGKENHNIGSLRFAFSLDTLPLTLSAPRHSSLDTRHFFLLHLDYQSTGAELELGARRSRTNVNNHPILIP